jgi:hypothetical protein
VKHVRDRSCPLGRWFGRGLLIVVLMAGAAACGKKGPPLPPLIRIPDQPADLVASRRGNAVAISFSVPDANTDGSSPANLDRIEVYAITAPANISDAEIRSRGELIATIPVNPPPEPEEPLRTVEGGINQGAEATLTEVLEPVLAQPTPADATDDTTEPEIEEQAAVPAFPSGLLRLPLLLPPPAPVATRVYIVVPIGGRRTGEAARSVVPLGAAPPPPPPARITYDEEEVTITWAPPSTAPAGLLAPRRLSLAGPPPAYHVYEAALEEGQVAERRLTENPTPTPSFVDPRVTFGEQRCYTVRVLQNVGTLSLESEALAPACVTLTDTFAPAPPTGLTTVPSDGAISLIWDPSDADDLGGYIVLRGEPGGTLSPITPAPVQDTSYRDVVPSGARVAYAVQAVDDEGNASTPSATVEDAAR